MPVFKFTTTASEAARSILGQQFEALRGTVDGIILDLDIEFLHDLRVANRRTRAVLSQLNGVFPKNETRQFSAEFKWLGKMTGPRRDLDVTLIEMDGFLREMELDDSALEPLRRLLKRSRATEHRRVTRALASTRFQVLVSNWSDFLDNPPPETPNSANANRPIGEVASERILKAFRRIVGRGATLADPPDPASLHRLRIDAKKLRYLLQFFAGLYPEPELIPLLKYLKRLQKVLGGFNDMEVQQTQLRTFADTIVQEGDARPDTVFAIGRLCDAMRERQTVHLAEFANRFAALSNRVLMPIVSSTPSAWEGSNSI